MRDSKARKPHLSMRALVTYFLDTECASTKFGECTEFVRRTEFHSHRSDVTPTLRKDYTRLPFLSKVVHSSYIKSNILRGTKRSFINSTPKNVLVPQTFSKLQGKYTAVVN